MDTSKTADVRVNDSFLAPLERPALQWLCKHMPAWMTPDILTVIGLIGGVVMAAGYWLCNVNKNFLWIVDLGLVINWFGDSLDGSLARYRRIERFKYGYFVDHTVDITTQTIVLPRPRSISVCPLQLRAASARRLFAPWDFNVYRHRRIRSVQNFLRQNRPHRSSRVRHRPECHILFRQ